MATSNDGNTAAAAASSTTHSQDDATSTTNQTQPLHRHPSITMSTTSKNPTLSNNPPPPSPAPSTTSKTSIYSGRSHSNSSSCGNSTSGSSRTNNMSVDDILSNPLLSIKRRRKMRDGTHSSSTSGGSVTNNGSRSRNTMQRQATAGNPGEDERKRRLERLQREKIEQRRLSTQQQQQSKEGGKKLLQMTSHEDQQKEEDEGIVDSLVSLSAAQASTDDFVKNDDEKKDNGDNDHDINDTTPHLPTTVESALSSLHSKYESCITTNIDTKQEQDEKEEEEISAKTSRTAVSPWSVIQVLPQVLQFANLKQRTSTTSDYQQTMSAEEQEKLSYIQRELSKVIVPVSLMKRKVMNRNLGLGNVAKSADEEEKIAQDHHVVKELSSLLQMIQIQVWIRMMTWSLEGDAGWTFLEEVVKLSEDAEDETGKKSKKQKAKKKKKKDKRKQQSAKGNNDEQTPRHALVEHLTSLLELIPYVLPPSMDFSVYVKDILTFGYRQNIPEYGAEILDHFEIEIVEPIALKRSGTDASLRSNRSEVSHSPVKKAAANAGGSPSKQIAERRAKRQQAYFASLMEEKDEKTSTSVNADDESATITGSISTVTSTSRGSKRSRGPDIEKDDSKLLKTSVSLTAAIRPKSKENPFLKGSARGTYVGSHLSSKLSNISSLFREVTIPVKKPKTKIAAGAAASASLLTNNKKNAVPKDKKRKGDDTGPKAPFNITAKVTREQRNVSDKTRVRETPTKKLKVNGISSFAGRADTYPPLSTPRRIIEETPAKSRRVVISETPQQQPRFRRQQLDLSNATRRQQERRVQNRHHASSNNNNSSLSPMIQYGGLSPMPQKKNVVADAAKAAARKRK